MKALTARAARLLPGGGRLRRAAPAAAVAALEKSQAPAAPTTPPPLFTPSPAPAARPTRDDVTRIAAGRPAKARGTGSRAVPHRLDAGERGAWEGAHRAGFLALHGSGSRRARKGSPAANAWRLACDARACGCVVLLRGLAGTPGAAVAAGADAVVVVDASPLRLLPPRPFPPALAAALDATAAGAGVSLVPPDSADAIEAIPFTYLGEVAMRDALDAADAAADAHTSAAQGGEQGGRLLHAAPPPPPPADGDGPPPTLTQPIWRLRPVGGVSGGSRAEAKSFAAAAAALVGCEKAATVGAGGAAPRGGKKVKVLRRRGGSGSTSSWEDEDEDGEAW